MCVYIYICIVYVYTHAFIYVWYTGQTNQFVTSVCIGVSARCRRGVSAAFVAFVVCRRLGFASACFCVQLRDRQVQVLATADDDGVLGSHEPEAGIAEPKPVVSEPIARRDCEDVGITDAPGTLTKRAKRKNKKSRRKLI